MLVLLSAIAFADIEDINKYNNTVPSNSDTSSTNGRIPLGTGGKGDEHHTQFSSVIKDGDSYKIWYTGSDGSTDRIYYVYSNPTVQFNNLSDVSGDVPLSYDFAISGNNIYENLECQVLETCPYTECSNATLIANPTGTSNATVNCTTSTTTCGNVYFMLNCNGASYQNINSTNTSIIIDTTDPTLDVFAPNAQNTTWNYIRDPFVFGATCSHPTPVNLTQFNVTCINQTGDIVFEDNQAMNNASYTYANITEVFNYVNNFKCQFECVDSFGHITEVFQNISTIEMNISKSDIGTYRQVNDDFTVTAPFGFNGDSAECALVPNTTSLSCTNYSGVTPATFNCTVPIGLEENTTMIMHCNDTARTWINNTVTDTSAYIFVDSIDPSITVLNWTANKNIC
jgi:hypothetical protein